MYFQKYRDNKGEWRWRLRAANHETIAVSSESYIYESSCDHSIDLVKSTNANTPVHKV